MVLSDFGLSSSTATRRRTNIEHEKERQRLSTTGRTPSASTAQKRASAGAMSCGGGAFVNGKRVIGTHMYLAPELTVMEEEILAAVDGLGDRSAFSFAAAADVYVPFFFHCYLFDLFLHFV